MHSNGVIEFSEAQTAELTSIVAAVQQADAALAAAEAARVRALARAGELARELAEVDVPVPVGVSLAIQLQHRADGAARASQSLRVEAGGGAVVRERCVAGLIRRGDEPAEGDIGRSPGDGDAPLASPPSASGQPRTFPSRRRRPMSRRRSRSFPWWAPRGWTCRRCRRENSTRQRLRLWSSLGVAKL